MTKSFSSASNLASGYPEQTQEAIVAGARSAFLDGQDWAYTAGLIAILLGAALVYFLFPKREREEALLADDAMVEYFRRRAVGTAVLAGAVAFIGIFVLRSDASYVFDGLTSRALPVVVVSAACGIASLVLLLRNALHGARPLAIGAVAAIVVAWGVAQWPYLLPESLKVSEAAAPSSTLATLVVATIGLCVIVVPGFVLLYVLDQRSLLPDEGVD